jgi:hypothetical protein
VEGAAAEEVEVILWVANWIMFQSLLQKDKSTARNSLIEFS